MGTKDIYALKSKANEYMRREKFEKALEIYETLLKETPDDTSVMLKIGNIHQTLGKESAAVEIYNRVAEFYYEREMYHQGVAVCRLILNEDPLNIPAQQRMVDMYIKLYGGLPRSRGDTIIPPRYVMNPENESVVEMEDALEATEPATESTSARESWKPVDIVFSNDDEDVFEAPDFVPDDDTPDDADSVIIVSDDDESDVDFIEEGGIPLPDVPRIPLFASLDENDLNIILENHPIVNVDKNVFVLKEGERGDSFFIILKGSVQVLKGDLMTPMARLSTGACFGEMALLGPGGRRASVLAVEPTTLLEIKDVEIERLQQRHPGVRAKLREYVRERLFENLMATSSLFCHFSAGAHAELRNHFELKSFQRRATVIKRGEAVEDLFLIVEGRVEVLLDFPRRRRQLIRTIGMGEIFGEIPLLTDAPSKVTFRAKDDLTTLALPKEKFKRLIMQHPSILSLVSELLESAEQSTDAYYR